jgi:lysozyme
MNSRLNPDVPSCRRTMLRKLGMLLLLATLVACERRTPASTGNTDASAGSVPQAATSASADARSTDTVEGVDLSNWDGGDVDFSSIKQAGKYFVFVKASQGGNVVDPDHARNVRKARAAGLSVGSYHFYVAADSPQDQFRNFSAQLSLQPGDLPPVVDIEVMGQGDTRPLVPALRQFLELLQEKVGVKPILYSGEYFANEYLSVFGDYPLWLAQYNGKAAPQLPKGWTQWTFWQYSQSGRVAGVPGNVDMNRFNGNQAQLKALTVR